MWLNRKDPGGYHRGSVLLPFSILLTHYEILPRCTFSLDKQYQVCFAFFFFYLIGEESQPLQEVLHQLELVSDGVFLHLSPDLLRLLGHALLQGGRDGRQTVGDCHSRAYRHHTHMHELAAYRFGYQLNEKISNLFLMVLQHKHGGFHIRFCVICAVNNFFPQLL